MVQVLIDNSPRSFTTDFAGIVNTIIIDVGITPLQRIEQVDEKDIVYLKALWDTGATNSVVTKETARKLGLVSIGKTNVHHAGGDSVTNVFMVHLFLPNRITVPVRVTECDDSTQFGLIIGMDVIAMGDFSITNAGGRTTVSFRTPSLERIDYNTGISAKKPEIMLPVAKKQHRNEPCSCGSNKKYKNCCGKGMSLN
jgi:predicted aspartyl protease